MPTPLFSSATKLLADIGLTTTESQIYLAGLGSVDVSVQELVKETNIQRTTIYHALHTLVEKGLAAKQQKGSHLRFAMTPPAQIERFIGQRIQNLTAQAKLAQQIAPLLERQRGIGSGTSVMQYEGIEGIKTAIDLALYCRSRRWEIIAPRKNFFSDFDKKYAQYFLETRKKRGIVTRSLWEQDGKQHTSPSGRRLTPEEIAQRNPRYLPKAMHGTFQAVMIIFDESVMFVSSLGEKNAVVITSKELSGMQRALFEGLWAIAKPY